MAYRQSDYLASEVTSGLYERLREMQAAQDALVGALGDLVNVYLAGADHDHGRGPVQDCPSDAGDCVVHAARAALKLAKGE